MIKFSKWFDITNPYHLSEFLYLKRNGEFRKEFKELLKREGVILDDFWMGLVEQRIVWQYCESIISAEKSRKLFAGKFSLGKG